MTLRRIMVMAMACLHFLRALLLRLGLPVSTNKLSHLRITKTDSAAFLPGSGMWIMDGSLSGILGSSQSPMADGDHGFSLLTDARFPNQCTDGNIKLSDDPANEHTELAAW
uniref:Uncharacterized protein n=1 Tax=Arundo donax TaxID=35708 RepID=A0A0A9E0Z6_ARUDO